MRFSARWQAGVLLLALLTADATAHPVDELVQGAYLTLRSGELELELDMTPGAEIADTVLGALDKNADQQISEAEANAYARLVLDQSSLTLDGTPLSLTIQKVSMPPYPNLRAGSDTIRIYAVAKRPERSGVHTLAYVNRYQPAKGQTTANVFLQPGSGWQYEVTAQQRSDDGRAFTATYTATRP